MAPRPRPFFRKHHRPCDQPAVEGGGEFFRPLPAQAGHFIRIKATPSDLPLMSTGRAMYPLPLQRGQSFGATHPPQLPRCFSLMRVRRARKLILLRNPNNTRASLSVQRAERGTIGPNIVLTTPVRTDPACSSAINRTPPVCDCGLSINRAPGRSNCARRIRVQWRFPAPSRRALRSGSTKCALLSPPFSEAVGARW